MKNKPKKQEKPENIGVSSVDGTHFDDFELTILGVKFIDIKSIKYNAIKPKAV